MISGNVRSSNGGVPPGTGTRVPYCAQPHHSSEGWSTLVAVRTTTLAAGTVIIMTAQGHVSVHPFNVLLTHTWGPPPCARLCTAHHLQRHPFPLTNDAMCLRKCSLQTTHGMKHGSLHTEGAFSHPTEAARVPVVEGVLSSRCTNHDGGDQQPRIILVPRFSHRQHYL